MPAVAIAIGEAILADRIASMLLQHPGLRLVDSDDSQAAVVLTDVLPDHDSGKPVIVIADRIDAFAALRAGAAGVLSSTVTGGQLRAAIEAAAQGLSVMPGDLRDMFDDPPEDDAASAATSPSVALTARELEVLDLIAAGASNKVIARNLNISVHTAKFHVASIIAKLDATGRTDAVAQAARSGLLML